MIRRLLFTLLRCKSLSANQRLRLAAHLNFKPENLNAARERPPRFRA